MALTVHPITRTFEYNGMKLDDPAGHMTPEQVKEHFSLIYPELLNASIDGPELKNDVHHYKFYKAAGGKG